MFSQRLAQAWSAVAEYFVPPAMAGDRDASNRARMFLISHLLGPVLGNSVPIALYVFDPTPRWDVPVLAVAISLFWVYPFLLRAGVRYERLVLLSVINLNFCILWSCYHYGGVASPTLTWVLIIPILSLFYVGGESRLQPKLLAITAVAFAIFFGAHAIYQPGSNDVPATAMVSLGAVSTVATLAYVATMAVYYARVFDAGMLLELEVKRRRQMADELRKAVIDVHRTGSVKAEFLARISHEIRTPLNAIIGYAQILQEDSEETDDKLFQTDVARILDAAHYLVRLVNGILDISKIEAGRMKFDVKPHDLGALLEQIAAARQPSFAARANRFEMRLAPGLGTVDLDEGRFTQIVDCILENATTYCADGSILMSAAEGLHNGQRVLCVSIADTGVGIAPEILPTLLETFTTPKAAAEGRYGGTGLNLAVASSLARAMGGGITVESTLGQGSTFTITLPLGGAAAAGQPLVTDAAA